MNKNLLTLLASLLVSAVVFVGCTGGDGSNVAKPKIHYWTGDACPITGNKNDSDDSDQVWLDFTHEGKDYSALVRNEEAIATFNKDKEKYIAIIVAKAELPKVHTQ